MGTEMTTQNVFSNSNIAVKKESLYQLIADKIERMILTDRLRPGDRLPSEADLAECFNVSRNVLREAMKVLKERELIDQRNGDGTYVAKPDSRNVTTVLNRFVLVNNIEYSDVYEMRIALEVPATGKAAQIIDEEGMEKLRQLIDGMADSKDDYAKRTEYDLRFHQMIVEYAGNPLFICVYDSVSELLKPILENGLRNEREGHENGILWHKRILEAFKQKDSKLAEELMHQHLEVSRILCADQ